MPKVIDSEGFAIDGPCRHPVLFFGSRGLVIICSNCSTVWETHAVQATEIDLSEVDRRVDPNSVDDK